MEQTFTILMYLHSYPIMYWITPHSRKLTRKDVMRTSTIKYFVSTVAITGEMI